eukprot:462022-Prorocentrum_minimum.AAC.1
MNKLPTIRGPKQSDPQPASLVPNWCLPRCPPGVDSVTPPPVERLQVASGLVNSPAGLLNSPTARQIRRQSLHPRGTTACAPLLIEFAGGSVTSLAGLLNSPAAR